jgi:hypothetical protein
VAFDAHSNFAYGLVTVAPSPATSGTSLTVNDASIFPAAPFNCTVWETASQPLVSNAEIVRVTAKVGNVLTIVRAQEGSSARTIVAGDQIAATITVKTLTDVEVAIPSIAGLISAVNVSAGATSNNLSALTFSNSNGVSFGLNGSVLTATVATNYQSPGAYLTTAALSQDSSKYAGTNGAITGGSLTVNTSGVSINLPAYLTTAMQSDAVTLSNVKVSAGASSTFLSALTFSNSNGLAFGLSAGTITGSYTVPAAQTGISGIIASDTTYTSGSVRWSGVGGGVTVSSNTGQRVDISVAAPVAQSVQTQNMVALSLSGNTAGVLAMVSSGTAYFAGGNNITLSQDGQSVTISGPNVGGAQTGISGLIVSDATYTSGTVSFSNAGNITIASSVNGATQYIKLSGNAAQTTQSAIKAFGVSNTGQTAGNTGLSTGIDWVLAGSQSITLSQSTAGGGPNTIWFQHPAWITTATQSNQSAIKAFGVSDTGQTAGNTGVSTGVDWVLAGSGSITLSQSTAGGGPNTVWVQHPAWLTTAALSQDSSKYAGTNGAITGGSITVNTSGVSVNLPAYLTTAALSGDTSKYVQEWALTGNTAGTTSSAQGTRLYFSGGNSITISGSSNSLVFSVGNYLTTAALSADSSKYAGTNGAITGGSITVNTSGVSVNLPAYISTQSTQFLALTLAGNTAGTSTFHATNNASLFLNGGNNITLSGNGSTVTIIGPNTSAQQTGISGIVVSDTTYTSGTVSFSNAGNITIASSVNGATQYIKLSGNAAQTNQSAIKAFGVSNTGQTAGNTGVSTGVDWVMAGSGSLTLSQSTAGGGPNTVWIQHPAWLTTADLSANSSKYVQEWALTGNTAGTTSSAQGTRLYFSGGNSLTISGNSNSLVFSVGNYLTTARGSTDAIGLNTAKTNVTWTANSSGLSFDAGGYAGTGFTSTTTAGTAIVGTNNTAGLSVGVPAFLTTADLSANSSKYAQAWELTGNTAGTTSSAQGTKWYLSGGANLTISGNSNTLVFSAGSAAPSPVNFSAGGAAGNLGSVVFSNSNGVSFGLNGSTITGTVSTYDTVGTATTVYSVASANSVGTVTRWAAEDHRHAGVGGFGISTSGNTSGTTGSNVGTVWLQGGNSITLSQITSNNGSHTIVVSGAIDGYNGWLEPYPLNTATQTLAPTAGSWYLAPFTAFGSLSGGRVNLLAINTGTAALFQDLGETAYKSNTTGTLSQRFTFSGAIALFSQGTGSNSTRLESVWSNSHSWGWSKVLNVSTNAASNIAVSLAHSISYQSDIGSDGAYTNVQYANAGSSTIGNSSGASTALSTVFSSGRNLISGSLVQPIGFSTTLTAGVYWLGYAWSTTRATASTGGQLGSAPDFGFSGLLGMSRLAVDSLYRNFGSTASTARSQFIPYGVYTGGANMAPPSAIALSSDLSSLASQWVPYFNFNYRGLTK